MASSHLKLSLLKWGPQLTNDFHLFSPDFKKKLEAKKKKKSALILLFFFHIADKLRLRGTK